MNLFIIFGVTFEFIVEILQLILGWKIVTIKLFLWFDHWMSNDLLQYVLVRGNEVQYKFG